MYEDDVHPLLAQVPLTVSPFVSLPSAITLPYTYKSLPPSLPPSSTADRSGEAVPDESRPKYIVSASGRAAHPDDIAASCKALSAHLEQLKTDAVEKLDKWSAEIKERELAEKRRVAPGWLDRDEKILQPARTQSTREVTTVQNVLEADDESEPAPANENDDDEGAQLDRAFGFVSLK